MEAPQPMINIANSMLRRNMAVNNRKILLNDDIDGDLISEALYYLYALENLDETTGTKEPIEILVDTNGGYVDAGLTLISYIENLKDKGYTIITTNIGKAYSMGLPIACCGSIRRCYRYAGYMVHEIASGSFGKLNKMYEDIEETKRIGKLTDSILIKYTGITQEYLDDIYMRKSDKFLSAEDAIGLNIVDEIV